MTTKHEQLAKSLQRRRAFSIAALVAVCVTGVVALIWAAASPIVEQNRVLAAEQEKFDAVKADFQDTWCATYGVDPSDFALAKWESWANRNRDFLVENGRDFGYVQKNLDGSESVVLFIDEVLRDAEYFTPRDFWFQSGLSNHSYVFQFGGEYDSPPTS